MKSGHSNARPNESMFAKIYIKQRFVKEALFSYPSKLFNIFNNKFLAVLHDLFSIRTLFRSELNSVCKLALRFECQHGLPHF